MEWSQKIEDGYKVYQTEEVFNGDTYRLEVTVDTESKTTKFWISLSSGRKRRDLEILEEKGKKSRGGLKALFWAREAIKDFEKGLNSGTLVIGWSDTRRKKIYQKYLKDFQIMKFNEGFVLVKKIK